jgi:hypothetical protein
MIDPQGARSYLEKYFVHHDISIYWGSSRQFVDDLYARCARNKLVWEPRPSTRHDGASLGVAANP